VSLPASGVVTPKVTRKKAVGAAQVTYSGDARDTGAM
jgi:hypothetical protein